MKKGKVMMGMTEKRFKVYKVSGNFGEWEVEDTLNDTVVMDRIMHKYLADRLCEKLNELNDENEKLKNSGQYWYNEHKRIVNNYVDKIKEVEKENEQLKKELDCFKPLIFESDGKPITLYEKKG